ncbi:MAG: hypothetical protein JWP93_976, partial [Polaromonas sp.]|nr:hypothetical protein [Polaromonas sp.]
WRINTNVTLGDNNFQLTFESSQSSVGMRLFSVATAFVGPRERCRQC